MTYVLRIEGYDAFRGSYDDLFDEDIPFSFMWLMWQTDISMKQIMSMFKIEFD